MLIKNYKKIQHWFKTLLQKGIIEPIFYGNLVYKFKRIIGNPYFSDNQTLEKIWI